MRTLTDREPRNHFFVATPELDLTQEDQLAYEDFSHREKEEKK
jgi:hypothetical protein